MGGRDPGRRTRALGTRDRVLSHLADGEISDPRGMASTVLAEAVGYPGSSAAFAQLLSGMERSGLIEREIRGKRTYRIAAAAGNRSGGNAAGRGATPPAAGRSAQPPDPGESDPSGDLLVPGGESADFDYDELARRLLVQVVRRLAVLPGDSPPPGHGSEGAQEIVGPAGPDPANTDPRDTGPDAALQQTVAGLEQKLASVRSRQRRLTAENARLREQLQAAQQSLAEAEERASAARVTGQLGRPELQLLERLLSATRDQSGRQEKPAPADSEPFSSAGLGRVQSLIRTAAVTDEITGDRPGVMITSNHVAAMAGGVPDPPGGRRCGPWPDRSLIERAKGARCCLD